MLMLETPILNLSLGLVEMRPGRDQQHQGARDQRQDQLQNPTSRLWNPTETRG